MKAAIIGATGYTGMILMRILTDHPGISDIIAVSSSSAGGNLAEADPGTATAVKGKTGITGGRFATIEEAAAMKPDVVFAALPHLQSARLCEPFFGNAVVIDLSADFRIKDEAVFEAAYGQKPERPDLLAEAVYGLCEIRRKETASADLIANPGCYPTASLLPLIPAAAEFGIKGSVIINALSGISGAGKKAVNNNLFVERTENCGAYAPGKSHRHQPEIKSVLDEAAGTDSDLFFTPHLVPLKRGMEVTTIFEPEKLPSDADMERLYSEWYGKSPFVAWDAGRLPQSRDVWGSNSCRISWNITGGKLMLFSVIDNLVKGASGQAVQNMNIRFGFEETAGLRLYGEL